MKTEGRWSLPPVLEGGNVEADQRHDGDDCAQDHHLMTLMTETPLATATTEASPTPQATFFMGLMDVVGGGVGASVAGGD